MKYVVALDVSMGKNYMVVYNANKFCERTGEDFTYPYGLSRIKDAFNGFQLPVNHLPLCLKPQVFIRVFVQSFLLFFSKYSLVRVASSPISSRS
ncbi:hypothetical protein SAMN05192534_13412 [Alteribacillus persepolensis]|uniref:Uncharacterized protein n=1 Tax=Alteribacillus persepolensis TaxID=568899 RepID=A0A1G8JL82_9BACI|nr:hypothetical protein SAMN05192534_13412 [Alteribacillus persepolensis]